MIFDESQLDSTRTWLHRVLAVARLLNVATVIPPDALHQTLCLKYVAIFDGSHVRLHSSDLAGQEVRKVAAENTKTKQKQRPAET